MRALELQEHTHNIFTRQCFETCPRASTNKCHSCHRLEGINCQKPYRICFLQFILKWRKTVIHTEKYQEITSQSALKSLPGTQGKPHTLVSITNWTHASFRPAPRYFYGSQLTLPDKGLATSPTMVPGATMQLFSTPILKSVVTTLCIPL